MLNSKPLRLLLVEDDPVQQRLTVELLELLPSFTATVTVRGSLQAAILELHNGENKFDLILLDLGLPDSFGIDTIKTVQQVTHTKILVLTGRDIDQKTLDDHCIKGYLNKTNLKLDALDYQIQLALEASSCKRLRERLERITSNLQRQIASLEVQA